MRVRMIAAGLALAIAGCSDPAATAKAEAEAKAKAAEAASAKKLKEKIQHNVQCLSAIQWQSGALAKAGIGALSIYQDYFRKKIETALADGELPAEGTRPKLGLTNVPAYLAAAYPEDVVKFTSGIDANKDGKLTPYEHSGRGFNTVTGCIQEVAEAGTGPLAGPDKVGRMYRMKAIQLKLADKGP